MALTKLNYYLLRLLQKVLGSHFQREKVAHLGQELILARYRAQGAEIGEGTQLINCKLSSSSKGDRFYIGKNCTITGVTLLAHDASPTLFLPELTNFTPAYLPGARSSYRDPIHIGDNVFIGWGSIVLPGVRIGSNVVIGAGSVVNRDIPDNSVAAGNPAKVLKDIDAYKAQYQERLQQSPECF